MKKRILADMTPDELLSTNLLRDNGIREPLYITAMRYAGIDITKEKKPSHVDFVDLDEHDKEKLRNWFFAQPLSYKEPEKETLLEVKNLSFGYNRGQQTLKNVSLSVKKSEMVSIIVLLILLMSWRKDRVMTANRQERQDCRCLKCCRKIS